MSESTHRCGWVALMGPPNAGKSTLLNTLMEQKITIVTPKPQTTRNQIVGILTEPGLQIIFMDTPGLSQGRGQLSKTMLQAVWQSLRQAEVIMPVLDAHTYILHPEYLDRDLAPIIEALRGETRPIVVVVNKIDLFSDKSRMLPLLTRLSEIWPDAEIYPLSALNKDGVEGLKEVLAARLPERGIEFPEDQVSTMPVRFMVSELIREKLFLHLREEVPYGTAVTIDKWEESPATKQTVIYATIYVSRPMHKAMVIGKRGAMIKQIGSEARQDIQELLEGRVHLELWVKVREHWSEDMTFLSDLELDNMGSFVDQTALPGDADKQDR
ncbi:MAG TPA: GTPase Era [Candidatus Desulfovibrio intestinipullorum]|uniref:GTPase Era n=1 Tax=Candidatus Desulfovibrio intestinipullorum TaxID=2838536 RepID=A0A9D1PWN2_9BACT|nr:GTPase Era [Candidatus Desulfovibrio intestinipullorum]